MDSSWDESFFNHGQVDRPVYWVCFWTAVEGSSAMHDPVRIERAESVDEVIRWINATRGSRAYELFVEANDRVETRNSGWVDQKQLVRLAGDFWQASTAVAARLSTRDD